MATTTLYPTANESYSSGTVGYYGDGTDYTNLIDSNDDTWMTLNQANAFASYPLTDMPISLTGVTSVTINVRMSDIGSKNDYAKLDYVQILKSDGSTAITSTGTATSSTVLTTYNISPDTIHYSDKTSWDGAVLKLKQTNTGTGTKWADVSVDITYTTGNIYDETGSGGALGGSTSLTRVIYNIGSCQGLLPAYGGAIGSGPIAGTPNSSSVEAGEAVSCATGGVTGAGLGLISYSEIASGGSLGGGLSLINLTLDDVASGGTLGSGLSLVNLTLGNTASGGSLGGGLSLVNLTLSNIASGGSLGGGLSLAGGITHEITSGGSLGGGLSLAGGTITENSSGGSLGSGLSLINLTLDNIASDGSLGGGLSLIEHNYIASGGSLGGGLSLIEHNYIASGGSLGGGSPIVGGTIREIPTGGAKCSGTTIVQKITTNNIVGIGGTIVGGHGATIDFVDGYGGSTVGGTGRIRQIHTCSTTSGSTVGGTLQINNTTINVTSIGGSTTGGLAKRSYLGLSGIRVGGGVLSGGTAKHVLISGFTTSGGGIVGGSVFLREIISGLGGVKSGGLSKSPSVYKLIALGGAIGGGFSAESQCIASIVTSSTKSPGTGISSSFSGYPIDAYVFNSPGNATSSDDAWATAIMTTDPSTAGWLVCKNFGLEIPNGSTIDGITIRIERSSSVSNRIKDSDIRLVKNGLLVGNNKANTSLFWGTTDAIRTYGSASDLWGTTWTKSELEDQNFGIAIKVSKTNAGSNIAAMIDYVEVTANFTGGFSACLLNSTSSGGLRCGGTVGDNVIASGGSVAGGNVDATGGVGVIIASMNPYGRGYVGGASIVQTIFNTPSYNGGLWGGSRIGGNAFKEVFFKTFLSGGTNAGGKANYDHFVIASGGISAGTTGDFAVVFSEILTRGGTSSGGIGKLSISYKPKSVTTGVIFGSKLYTSINGLFTYNELMRGGTYANGSAVNYTSRISSNKIAIKVGGTVAPLQIFVGVPTGGASLGSESINNFIGSSNSFGGASLSGISPIYENVSGRGGAKINGTSKINVRYTTRSISGVSLGGLAINVSAVISQTFGGVKNSGISPSYKLLQDITSGGVVISGLVRITFNNIASGGTSLGGSAIYDLNKIVETSGGCTISGVNIISSVWCIKGVSGAKLGSRAKITIIKKVNTVLIKRIGDLLISDNVYKVDEIIYGLFQIDGGINLEIDDSLPRTNENNEWCQVVVRCKEGTVPKLVLDRQISYAPPLKEIT